MGRAPPPDPRSPRGARMPRALAFVRGQRAGVYAGSMNQPEHVTRPLVGILDEIRAEFNVDARRICVTGISMGCYGVWDMIMRNPGWHVLTGELQGHTTAIQRIGFQMFPAATAPDAGLAIPPPVDILIDNLVLQ